MGADADLRIRAIERGLAIRAPESPGGVAATVLRWAEQGEGVVDVRVRLSDGTLFGWLSVVIDRGAAAPRASEVERAVEELATTLAGDDRLEALERRSPMRWRAGDGLVAA